MFRKTFFFVTLWMVLSSCHEPEQNLFKKLEAHKTGLNYVNKLEETDELNAFNFTNFYNGGGVGVGDFNNDGHKDLVLTSNQARPGLFINKGEGLQFKDSSEGSGLFNDGWVCGVAVVDINQDGWDDIYLSKAVHERFENSQNLLFINQKTAKPTFKEAARVYGLNDPSFTTQTAFFDFDNDGDLDAFLLNTSPDLENPNYLRHVSSDGSHPSTDKLYENIGKVDDEYRYKNISSEAGIVYEGLGLGLALSDFNQDGYTDIYCSNDFLSSDILYLNNGDGTFKNSIKKATNHTSMYGMGIDAADFNNDEKVDIFQLDMLPEGNLRQKQMISGSDYDKKQLSTSARYGYMPQYMRNSLQLNMGSREGLPLFSEVGLLYGIAKTDWSWSILLADLNLDGFKDIFISNGYRKNVTDLDFINYNHTSSAFGTDASRAQKRKELLKDVPEIKLKNYAFANQEGNTFKDVSSSWGLDELSYSNGAAYADLDGDGDLDLVVNNIDAEVSVFENQLNPVHSLSIVFKGKKNNQKGIGAKVKAYKGDQVLFYEVFPTRGYLSSVATEVVLPAGVDSLKVVWPGGKQEIKHLSETVRTVVLSERNAVNKTSTSENTLHNHKLFERALEEFLLAHRNSEYNDFNHTPALHKMQSKVGPSLSSYDLNRDGWEDIIVPGSYNGSPTYFIYMKESNVLCVDSLVTPFTVSQALCMDLEQDGYTEVLLIPALSERPWTVKEAYQPLIYSFQPSGLVECVGSLPEMKVSSGASIICDYDSDGDMDLIVAGGSIPQKYPFSSKSYVLENNKGVFHLVDNELAQILSQHGRVKDIQWLKIDSEDGSLVLVSEWGEPTLITKRGSSYTAQSLLPGSTGWWNCIEPIDIDQDGDLDFFIGNEGYNTVFRASKQKPVRLVADDFNGDGLIDPIIAYYLMETEVPFVPLSTLNQQIIQLKKRFPLYSTYAKVNFEGLLSNLELDNALQLDANELASVLLINNGDGTYYRKELPKLAQMGPVYDVLFKDFNSDGKEELLLVGGFYENESNMGPQDALHGLLLKTNSNGDLEAYLSEDSGFYTRGAVRSTVFLSEQRLLVSGVQNGNLIFHKVR